MKTACPTAEVLESVKDYQLLRTDQNGWIEITTDGDQMWVNVERKSNDTGESS